MENMRGIKWERIFKRQETEQEYLLWPVPRRPVKCWGYVVSYLDKESRSEVISTCRREKLEKSWRKAEEKPKKRCRERCGETRNLLAPLLLTFVQP